MDPITLLTLLASTGAGVVFSLLAELVQGRRRSKAVTQVPTLEARLRDLSELMQSSSRVLEEVQAEIQVRITLAEKAKQDAEDAERIAQLNESQRLALAKLVRTEVASEVARGGQKSFWQGVAVNFVFFALGIGTTIALTHWFHL